MDARTRDRAALLALTGAALLRSLAYRIDYDEDIDALRFALGVERFDPAALRPHAPFYPVYIALAKLVAAAGASPRGALAIVSAATGALLVAFTALLAREVSGRRAAYFAGGLALASPFLWVSSEKLMSDVPGAAVTTGALWLCAKARRLSSEGDADGARRARTVALVALGVGLGVRLSYFSVAIACAFVIARAEGSWRAAASRAGDVGAGILLWLVPLAAMTPARDLVATTAIQGIGHFTRWGGTALTVSSPVERAAGGAWGLWANVLGGAWPDAAAARWIAAPILVVLLALPLVARRRGAPRAGRALAVRALALAQPELVASAVAYFVWAALGQNTVYKPRHFMPLAPLFIVALGHGASILLERGRAFVIPALVLGAQWLADGAALARAHVSPSPAAAIVGFLDRSSEIDARRVLTRDIAHMIAVGAPRRDVLRVSGDESLLAAVKEAGAAGALVTTEAMSLAAESALLARGYAVRVAFAAPRSRYIDALWSELALVEVKPMAPAPAPSSP
jgi:hypothetical protein